MEAIISAFCARAPRRPLDFFQNSDVSHKKSAEMDAKRRAPGGVGEQLFFSEGENVAHFFRGVS